MVTMARFKHRALVTALAASTALTGCLDSGGQTDKNANPTYSVSNPNILAEGTSPIFRPLETQFPLPSDPLFYLNKELDGTMLNGTDPENPVTTGLGFVDGNSVLAPFDIKMRSEEHTSELQSRPHLVCRLLLEKKKKKKK